MIVLSRRYILEAPDTQATNENQEFKIMSLFGYTISISAPIGCIVVLTRLAVTAVISL